VVGLTGLIPFSVEHAAMSIHEDWQSPNAPKAGMSTAAKVLIVLGAFGGLSLLVCCGGAFYLFRKVQDIAKDATADRPEKVVLIDPPPGFKQSQSVDMFVMRIVGYIHENNPKSTIALVEFNKNVFPKMDPAQQRLQMRTQLQQQQGQERRIQVEETEKRTFTVCGKEVEFEFNVGKDDQGTVVHEVMGVFETAHGLVLLLLIADEQQYDEAAVVKMIESIRDPAESEDEAEEGDPADQPSAEATPKTDASPPGEQSPPANEK